MQNRMLDDKTYFPTKAREVLLEEVARMTPVIKAIFIGAVPVGSYVSREDEEVLGDDDFDIDEEPIDLEEDDWGEASDEDREFMAQVQEYHVTILSDSGGQDTVLDWLAVRCEGLLLTALEEELGYEPPVHWHYRADYVDDRIADVLLFRRIDP